jgi:hypothetical protein
MSDGQRLTDEQVAQIVAAVRTGEVQKAHACRFDDIEARRVHSLSDSLSGDGMENFRAVLEFGAMLRSIRKWGVAAIMAAVIAALVAWLWAGFVAAVKKG